MHIDRLTVENYKGFTRREFRFNPEFNLLIGENGSGKTTALEAVSLALAQVLAILHSLPVNLQTKQIRHVKRGEGGAVRFEPQFPFTLNWNGEFHGEPMSCRAEVPSESTVGNWAHARTDAFGSLVRQISKFKVVPDSTLPLIAFYRASRSKNDGNLQPIQWQPIMTVKPQRLDGYVQCLAAATDAQSFVSWLAREQIISLQESASTKLFASVERAVCGCLPGAESLSFVVSESEPVIRLSGARSLLLSDLSDGQRGLLALAADMAIRAVQLNGHLEGDILAQCPGVVLIDELDLHLHPRWQRHVIADLCRIFPKVQFIATTHSPQLIGETPPEQILILTSEGVKRADQSFGLDSNEVLAQVMDAPTRNEQVARDLAEIDRLIEAAELDQAKEKIARLRELQQGPSDATVRAQALVEQIEILAEEMGPAE